jgi:HTH-type transcriptional regulator/antitoxin HigA
MFGVEQQIKQLSSELEEYDDTVSGKAKLPDPALVEEIPILLIRWRIARHWTQRDLADRVGLHENQIQKYESEGYGGASLLTVGKIAAALKHGQK